MFTYYYYYSDQWNMYTLTAGSTALEFMLLIAFWTGHRPINLIKLVQTASIFNWLDQYASNPTLFVSVKLWKQPKSEQVFYQQCKKNFRDGGYSGMDGSRMQRNVLMHRFVCCGRRRVFELFVYQQYAEMLVLSPRMTKYEGMRTTWKNINVKSFLSRKAALISVSLVLN